MFYSVRRKKASDLSHTASYLHFSSPHFSKYSFTASTTTSFILKPEWTAWTFSDLWRLSLTEIESLFNRMLPEQAHHRHRKLLSRQTCCKNSKYYASSVATGTVPLQGICPVMQAKATLATLFPLYTSFLMHLGYTPL